MPIFKCFFKIVIKNKLSLLVNICVFAALMIIFTSMGGAEHYTGYNEAAVRLAVVDRDQSELSRAITDFLDERHELKKYIPDDPEKLQDALFYRDVEYILTIPGGFEEAFFDGGGTLENVKLPDSATGIYVDNHIDRYLATVRAYLSADFNLSDSLSHTAEDMRLGTTVEVFGGEEQATAATYYYFQYLAYILIALIIAALGPVLIAFHKRDLRGRMDSSSFKLRARNAQTALGSVAVSIALWALFMLAALVLYRGDMLTAAAGLQVLNSLAFLTVCVSIAFLMGQLLSNANALGAVTNAVALGMSFLCGVFVQQELLGKTVLAIGKFLPAYWYVRSNDMLVGAGAPDMGLFGEGILIQFGFAVAIFAVALVVSRQIRNHPAAA